MKLNCQQERNIVNIIKVFYFLFVPLCKLRLGKYQNYEIARLIYHKIDIRSVRLHGMLNIITLRV